MRRRGAIAAIAVGVAALGIAAYALAGGSGAGFNHLTATMSGYQETPAAISSTGSAQFTADVSNDGQSISWQLTYGGLEGDVTQSHIHFGQRGITGGISVFLCTNLGNGPAGTPACPDSAGTVTGSITAASIIGPAAQNVTPGNFEGFEDILESHTAYGNIHTAKFPAGEIRGQIHRGDFNGHDGRK